jgi:hypothetical protein
MALRTETAMRRLLIIALLVLLPVSAGAQGWRRVCDPGGNCFICPRGLLNWEVANVFSRALTPQQPSYQPPPPPYRPPQQLSEDEWRRRIFDEAVRFCDAYQGTRYDDNDVNDPNRTWCACMDTPNSQP